MMDEEWEELERNGAKEVLTSTCFIETQKLEQRNSLGAFWIASTWNEVTIDAWQ